jgi:acetyltransferase-like isoleucine patch superfamily enzyme
MKRLAKRIQLLMAIGLVSPLLLTVLFSRWIFGWKSAFESGAQWVSVVPGGMGNEFRRAYYYCFLKSFDSSARVCLGSVICDPRSEIGSHVYIGTYCEMGWVRIGADTLVASRVMIPSGKRVHGFDRIDIPIRMQTRKPEQVVVGTDCWIGTSAVVMADVGEQTVVGAGAVVVKPLPAKSLCGGNPAKVIRSRSEPASSEPA